MTATEEKTELANGTRIRVLRDRAHGAKVKAGDLGTIRDTNRRWDLGDSYRVLMDEPTEPFVGNGVTWHWYLKPEDFEVVPETHFGFKVGDLVRVKTPDPMGYLPHLQGVVARVTGGSGDFLRIEWDGAAPGQVGGYYPDRFERVESEPTEAPEEEVAPLVDQLPSWVQRELVGRHRAVREVAQFFGYQHLPEHLQEVSGYFAALVGDLLHEVPDSPELTRALEALLEAKDHAVRAAVLGHAVNGEEV